MSRTGTQTVNVNYGPWNTTYKINIIDPNVASNGDNTKSEGTTSTRAVNNDRTNKPSFVQYKNPVKVKITRYKIKRSALKKKKVIKLSVKKAKGKVTCSLDKGAKRAKIKVSKKGRITIPKRCRKGKYKVYVKAAGNKSYGRKTITVNIRVY